ncbi:conjugal transfer protein [Enterococcus plantarum]|uniref:conjugal transfer protein n=1 Tax=Enterococcus plantarum TaxID=1077675 RepID=UPI001A8D8E66|nr:conjugal transfer protein [Enterococcus plantarum]MBO0422303.1 conjugal transfer protein [Enterococcus plantarum]
MKIKIERKEKKPKQKRVPTVKVGTHKKSVTLLWCLLIVSVCFGVYKNFTAIDQHTVHEKEIIEQRVIDTSKVKSFTENFIQEFYSWEHSQTALDKRKKNLETYLTEELQVLNSDVVRTDIPTNSKVEAIQFWDIQQIDDTNFEVLFSVKQLISEKEKKQTVDSVYTLIVYVDKANNMVITKNPTISSKPTKASYEPKKLENDGTVDVKTTEEINSFLETFFKLYPKANEKELSYYVSENALKPIGKDYVFVELINPIYIKKENQILVQVSVKYLDQQTKMTQISQFKIFLEKKGNWMIIKSRK